jgi:hypothetical protein
VQLPTGMRSCQVLLCLYNRPIPILSVIFARGQHVGPSPHTAAHVTGSVRLVRRLVPVFLNMFE